MFGELIQDLLKRPIDSHKYDFGHVLIIGGSPGMVGAPLLSAKATLRIGAGLVTIASTAVVTDKLEKRVDEAMTLTVPLKVPAAIKQLEEFIKQRKVSVAVIGPGMPPDSGQLIAGLIKRLEIPLVIDGGGLSSLANILKLSISSPVILTPHIGEFQRFFNKPLPKGRQELKPIAQAFAKTHNLTLVLKGQPTYVATADGEVYENHTGGPALATAGTGDVLAGIIGGLIAQHTEPELAAKAGVYLHGLAGNLAANAKTEPGVIASDVIEAIPLTLKKARIVTGLDLPRQ